MESNFYSSDEDLFTHHTSPNPFDEVCFESSIGDFEYNFEFPEACEMSPEKPSQKALEIESLDYVLNL